MNVECCWKKRIKIVILPLAHLQGNSLFVLRCVECFRYLQLLWTHLFASHIPIPGINPGATNILLPQIYRFLNRNSEFIIRGSLFKNLKMNIEL